MQAALLSQLGVNPWSSETMSWPLQVHPRTLAVLAQVLHLKHDPQEKVSPKPSGCLNFNSIFSRNGHVLASGNA